MDKLTDRERELLKWIIKPVVVTAGIIALIVYLVRRFKK